MDQVVAVVHLVLQDLVALLAQVVVADQVVRVDLTDQVADLK